MKKSPPSTGSREHMWANLVCMSRLPHPPKASLASTKPRRPCILTVRVLQATYRYCTHERGTHRIESTMQIPNNTVPCSTTTSQSMKSAEKALEGLLSTYHELNNAFVPRVPGPPTPLEFLQYVRRNQPVVFTGLMEGWGALERWDDMYLREKMQGCNIDVAVTPLGFVPFVMVLTCTTILPISYPTVVNRYSIR